MTHAIDRPRAAAAVGELLRALGLDPSSEQLAQTPARVVETFAEFFSGVESDPAAFLADPIAVREHTGDAVALRDIEFRSVCEHHLLPFDGVAHIAYLPAAQVVGLSALPRVVAALAARPQVQERLGEQICEVIERELAPRGVLVMLQARHGCLADRGVQQTHSRVVTLASRGELRAPGPRREALQLLIGGQAEGRPAE